MNIELMWVAKKLKMCLIYHKFSLPEVLWLVNMQQQQSEYFSPFK